MEKDNYVKDVEINTKEKPTCGNFPGSIVTQVRCAFVAAIGSFLCGCIIGWSGSSLTKLDEEFGMGPNEYSLVVSMLGYGGLAGSLLSGEVQDALGRRKTMIFVTPLIACGWLLLGLAKTIYFVYIARFILALGTGFLLNCCPIYISETCQASIRGRLNCFTGINLAVGVFVAYVLGGAVSWRSSCFLLIIPAIIYFVNLFMIPESPYWHLLQNNSAAASVGLRRLRGLKFDVESEIKDISDKIKDVGKSVSYRELINPRTLNPLLVALYIQTLQQICGAGIAILYTSQIFEKANVSGSPEMATIYSGISQILGTFVSLFLIDRYGRRILLSLSVGSCGIFTFCLGLYFLLLDTERSWPTWSPLILVTGIVFCFSLGARSIPWLIGGELFNTSVRSRANAVVVVYNRFLIIIISQVYPFTVVAFGDSGVFLIYGVLCFLLTVGTLLFVPETKGKTLVEIQNYFESRTSKKNAKNVNDNE